LHHIRDQLFAEAKVYYAAHPLDWWRLDTEAEQDAGTIREARRQKSVYEDRLDTWLLDNAIDSQPGYLVTYWEQIAEECLDLTPYQWSHKPTQLEVSKALRALHWVYNPNQQRLIDKKGRRIKVRTWRLRLPQSRQEGSA
jgi:hypothetical protein